MRRMLDRRLALEEITFLSDRYFVLAFHDPQIAGAAAAGQFLMISVSDAADPLLRRPMAFYRVLRQGSRAVGFSLLVEQTGRGTRLLARFRRGDETDVLGPLGRPFRLPDAPGDREHLLVMGGVGAAPFPLLAEALLARGARVRAFVGGRTRDDLLCLDDFEELGVPVEIATDDGSAGYHGFVTGALQPFLEGGSAAHVYSCGPTPMMQAVDALTTTHGLPHQVSLEAPMACGIGVCLSCVVRVRQDDGDWRYRRICREGPVFDTAVLMWK